MRVTPSRRFVATLVTGAVAFACAAFAQQSPGAEPSRAEAILKTLDPFYKQHVVVDDLLIVSSEKVSEYALREVAYLTKKMLVNRPDVLDKLVERKRYVCIMAYNEMQTDLPECRKLSLWWAKRARGLADFPISCAEENLLSFKGDPYKGENIFIHEFAHGLQGALAALDRQFDARVRELHKKLEATSRFRGYGMNNFGELWAEGVQSWFECNRAGGLEALGPDGEHLCEIHTRRQLKEHMPELAKLLDEAFRQNEWVYVPVLKRLDEPHLRGYNPAEAPTFVWPPKVIEAYNRIEAERAEKRKRQKEGAAEEYDFYRNLRYHAKVLPGEGRTQIEEEARAADAQKAKIEETIHQLPELEKAMDVHLQEKDRKKKDELKHALDYHVVLKTRGY